MSDRRAEAFAVLVKLEADAQYWLALMLVRNERENMEVSVRHWKLTVAYLAALRLVLERHHDGGGGLCWWCTRFAPCQDETDVIDAVLGVKP